MSCPTYKTSNGLQIGGIDPNLVGAVANTEPKKEEAPTEEIASDKTEVKEVKKTTKKPAKKTTTKKR